ncbi:MAG TPA: HAD-IA family hydrolase [Gammaproteobacteria bacterium]
MKSGSEPLFGGTTSRAPTADGPKEGANPDFARLLRGIDAVTFDFFNTLAFHREGHGRGRAVMDYLAAHGFECAPWRHEILYEIFAGYERIGAPSAPKEARRARRITLAKRLFEHLEIDAGDDEAELHADALWKLLGPDSFEVFSDVTASLGALRSEGFPLAIVSNWPCGLGHFCTELGLAEYFDAILCSAEVGAAKPDPRIFAEAVARLRVDPARVLHVGDTLVDDYDGAAAAGLRPVLIARYGEPSAGRARVIRSLGELTRGL